MSATVVRIQGRALLYSRYACERCGQERTGTGFEVPFDTYDTEDISGWLRSIRPAAHNMPVGWASHTDGYTCDNCNRENKE